MQTTSFWKKSLGLIVLATLVSCSSAPKKEKTTPQKEESMAAVEEPAIRDSDSGTAYGLQTIHFDYDSYALRPDAKDILKKNAQILKDKPNLKVQIEGHCDERGSIQYNLALGEKRAQAARKELIRLGISPDRLSTISYGKERPLDPGHNESAWAKNRRANLVIVGE